MSELRIKGTDDLLRIENVFCVGKNYQDHIAEMKDYETKPPELPKEPVIFLKPNSSVITNDYFVTIPEFEGKKISENLQHEVELVIVIGKDGKNIHIKNAYEFVLGYSVGIDFTLRDVQSKQKEKGLPWATSKGFYTSASVSDVVRKEEIADPEDLRISLEVNHELRQDARTSEMLYKLDFIISYLSHIFSLQRGDIIFTGTPAGVSKLRPGDEIKAMIEQIGKIEVKVV